MSELEKELKQLRQTYLQMAQENAQITSELENLQTAMVKITEQAIAAVQVTQLQGEQIKRLKDTIAANEMGDGMAAEFLKAIDGIAEIQRLKAQIEQLKGEEMGDELNAEEAKRHAAAEYRTMALFVDAVRVMRVMQKNYVDNPPDESVLFMAKQFETKVDNTISNDIFFIELLKKL
jgi:small-conductance mechanosensitive channel